MPENRAFRKKESKFFRKMNQKLFMNQNFFAELIPPTNYIKTGPDKGES